MTAEPLTIDVPTETEPAPTQAVALRPAAAIEKPPEPLKAPMTAAQAKIEAVAQLTAAAYAKASELVLTAEEVKALQAEFPDAAFKPGAAGKENLIYIEHAFLRDRLNEVIGPGQWALIPRSRWAEDFTANTRNGPVQASRVYVEAMLLVRGCFVAEAVGEMEYWKNNAAQNYGDAVEGAKTAALRRCCKEFGIGLQAWKKDWCEGWWQRKRGNGRPPTSAPAPAPKPQPKPEAPKYATAATRTWMIEQLTDYRELAGEYFRAISQLLPNEEIEDLPLEYVPISKAQLDALKAKLTAFSDGDPAERAFAPNPQPLAGKSAMAGGSGGPVDASSEPWYNAIVPVPRKGQKRDDYLKAPDTIGSLWEARHGTDDLAQEARQRLWGFVTNYEPKGWTKRDGTQMPASDSDRAFRASLDSFAEWFKQHHPDEKL